MVEPETRWLIYLTKRNSPGTFPLSLCDNASIISESLMISQFNDVVDYAL